MKSEYISGSSAPERGSKNIIVIDAAKKPEQIKLRVAAYCRVSSDSDDQENSFAAQERYFAAKISATDNWCLADIYADEGITGTSAEKRPDFQRLLTDCRQGLVDKVITKSISRFARNTTNCLEAIRELRSLGIGVLFEKENIDTSSMDGEMMTALFASFAQAESESISGNMRWSYKRRMESGTFIPAPLPYGYIHNGKEISIHDDKAQVVKRIFSDYLSGLSTDAIAQNLNNEGVPSRNAPRNWNGSSIRYILTNEKYTGDSLWQKYYMTDSLPTKCVKNHGEKASYFALGTHDAIITKEYFEAAQRLMKNRASTYSSSIRYNSPLKQKLFCAECGRYFRRKVNSGKVYWVCHGHDKEVGSTCKLTPIPEEEIHSAFLRLFYKLKHHGEPILSEMLSQLTELQSRQMLWSSDIMDLNKQIGDISEKNRLLKELKRLELVDSDFYIQSSNDLASQLLSAKQAKSKLICQTKDDAILLTQDLIEALEVAPDILDSFDGEWFNELVVKVTVESCESLIFKLKNGLDIRERIVRTVR